MTTTPVTDYGYSYEYGVDILTGPDTWQPIRFISDIQPSVSYKEEDAATYDDLGADHPVRTGETASLSFTIQEQRLAEGTYLPEVELLLAAAAPGANGAAATVTVRYYDKPAGSRKANPKDAFQMTATVNEFSRQNTGNSGIGGWTVKLSGQGPRTQITNPVTAGVGA